MRRALLVGCAAVLLAACGSRRVGGKGPSMARTSTVVLGDCADPERDGVLGNAPRLERSSRDLDDDGAGELVAVDRALCTRDGNCYWNLFSDGHTGGCRRYLGTVEATAIEPLAERGDQGYRDLRGWWKLTGEGRFLLQTYRYRSGGYRVIDALVCRQEGDDRLLCASDRNPNREHDRN